MFIIEFLLTRIEPAKEKRDSNLLEGILSTSRSIHEEVWVIKEQFCWEKGQRADEYLRNTLGANNASSIIKPDNASFPDTQMQ